MEQKIYFGIEYKNRLGSLLFGDSYGRFPAVANYGADENNDSFIKFVRKFGLKKFPIIEAKEVFSNFEQYEEYYKNLL